MNAGAGLVAIGFEPAVNAASGTPTISGTLVGLGLGCAAVGFGATLALLVLAARPGPPTRLAAYGASASGRG